MNEIHDVQADSGVIFCFNSYRTPRQRQKERTKHKKNRQPRHDLCYIDDQLAEHDHVAGDGAPH